MQSQFVTWAVVATTVEHARCAELALVLTARGLESRVLPAGNGWELAVPVDEVQRAIAELAAYSNENARPTGARRLEVVGFGFGGAAAYVLVLIVVYLSIRTNALDLDWYGAGRLVAGRVLDGEWWRTVTALTMHLDLDHLGGNLLFGTFFGYFAARHLGPGVAWLAIVGSGTLGNVLSALVQNPQHAAIGASTAVFAALGMLTAYTWRRGFMRGTPWRARIGPIVAGLGLLAFTGTGGENTDIFAHLTGFVSGFGCGLLLARYARIDITRRPQTQRACSVAAAALVGGAWAWGLLAAG